MGVRARPGTQSGTSRGGQAWDAERKDSRGGQAEEARQKRPDPVCAIDKGGMMVSWTASPAPQDQLVLYFGG